MCTLKLVVRGVLAGFLMLAAGCAVPQKPGKGMVTRRVEPTTNTGYYLYLPQDYMDNNGVRPDRQRWPLVVTIHGMNPFDTAYDQIREWQEEADRYNFIVIAPEMRTSNGISPYPLRDPELDCVKKDEKAVLAIMDEVFRQTNADPSRVLMTSWSAGGYMAHYMVNRHSNRFTCLAVRGSNFGESLMNPGLVPRYRHMRIGIFFGENDFKICRDESIQAVEWYRRFRFPVEAKYVTGMGHERVPQVAAAFFARHIGVTPRTPPELGTLVLRDIPPEELHGYSSSNSRTPLPFESSPRSGRIGPRRPPDGSTIFDANASPAAPTRIPAGEPVRRAPQTVVATPPPTQTPRRPTPPAGERDGQKPVAPY